jgi:RNA polymerase sigma-70 factor (family 1)
MNFYDSLMDTELTALLRAGDQHAYTEIYDRYQELLYIYACKVTKDEDEAEDIVQEVFFYLWDKRGSINFNGAFASYLYTAVRYKFFNLLDHKKTRSNYAESLQHYVQSAVVQPDHQVREKELNKIIETEISMLPPKMREIFELSRKISLPHKAIALQLNISEKTVKNQVNNALKQLRVKLAMFLL